MSIQSLFSHTLAALFVLAFGFTMTACVSQTPVPQYSSDIAIAVFNCGNSNGRIFCEHILQSVFKTEISKILGKANLSYALEVL